MYLTNFTKIGTKALMSILLEMHRVLLIFMNQQQNIVKSLGYSFAEHTSHANHFSLARNQIVCAINHTNTHLYRVGLRVVFLSRQVVRVR